MKQEEDSYVKLKEKNIIFNWNW